MEIFLSCIFVIAIIILIFRIVDFSVKLIIHNKQMSTRNYDIESVLDRLQTAEKQFQKNEERKIAEEKTREMYANFTDDDWRALGDNY